MAAGVMPVEACYRLDLPEDAWLDGILRGALELSGAAAGRVRYQRAGAERERRIGDAASPPAEADAAGGLAPVSLASLASNGARDHTEVYVPLPSTTFAREELLLSLESAPRMPAATQAVWSRWVEHLAHGARMRHALTSAPEAPAGAPPPRAPVAPLTLLRRVTTPALEAGQGLAPDALRALWEEALSGRWTIVDRHRAGPDTVAALRRNPSGQHDPRGLTPREMQVASEIARGHTNKHIAYALGIAEGTVAALGKGVMAKLGARTRVLVHDAYVGPTAPGVEARVAEVRVGTESVRVVAWRSPALSQAPHGLSPSEVAVVEAVTAGLSNTAIARARGTSVRTVANQIAAVFRKLRVSSRSELLRVLRHAPAPDARG